VVGCGAAVGVAAGAQAARIVAPAVKLTIFRKSRLDTDTLFFISFLHYSLLL
jgi:predicted lipid carrier protein YhbT